MERWIFCKIWTLLFYLCSLLIEKKWDGCFVKNSGVQKRNFKFHFAEDQCQNHRCTTDQGWPVWSNESTVLQIQAKGLLRWFIITLRYIIHQLWWPLLPLQVPYLPERLWFFLDNVQAISWDYHSAQDTALQSSS